jgi:hypothetical protein
VKYLKRYNEGIDMFKTYTKDELEEIFLLNLEDNTEFDLVNIELIVLNPDDPLSNYIIKLTENFTNNALLDISKFAKMRLIRIKRQIVIDKNKRLLYKIGKKYDLDICNITIYSWQGIHTIPSDPRLLYGIIFNVIQSHNKRL